MPLPKGIDADAAAGVGSGIDPPLLVLPPEGIGKPTLGAGWFDGSFTAACQGKVVSTVGSAEMNTLPNGLSGPFDNVVIPFSELLLIWAIAEVAFHTAVPLLPSSMRVLPFTVSESLEGDRSPPAPNAIIGWLPASAPFARVSPLIVALPPLGMPIS